MSDPSDRETRRMLEETDNPEEDLLADGVSDAEEEDEGEDLFGEGMADDYRILNEQDQYDPDLVDDAEQEPLTIEQRMAAERAMEARDGRTPTRRRPRYADVGTPGAPLGPSSSPGASSDASLEPESGDGAKRRRTVDGTPGDGAYDDGESEEDVPASYYDLNKEELDCYDIIAELWQERSVCFLECGESVYFPQSLALYSQITSKYEQIGIYKIRLDVEDNPVKTMWPLNFEYKYVAWTNRPKVLIKFYDAEPDDYSLHCPFADCDGGRDSCRNSGEGHSVSLKIDGHQKPQLLGFDVSWPLG